MNTYEFFEALKDCNYRLAPEKLEKLVNSVKHGGNYNQQKIKYITDKIIDLGYAEKVELCHDGDFCEVGFYIQYCELWFDINFDDGEHVKITLESYDFGFGHNEITCNQPAGDLSVDTFANILYLFKTYGKCASINNPNIMTLLENSKIMTKSANTAL